MSQLLRDLANGAAVPMPLQQSTIGRRETEGYRHPPEAPRPVRYALGRLYQAMKKTGGVGHTRVFAVALCLANECARLSDAEYDEFSAGLLNCLDEGRRAAKLQMLPKGE